MEEIAQNPFIGICANVKKKTLIRIASKNSLRSVMPFLLVVSVTHLIEGKVPMKHPAKQKLGTDGSKKLLMLIEKATGKEGMF